MGTFMEAEKKRIERRARKIADERALCRYFIVGSIEVNGTWLEMHPLGFESFQEAKTQFDLMKLDERCALIQEGISFACPKCKHKIFEPPEPLKRSNIGKGWVGVDRPVEEIKVPDFDEVKEFELPSFRDWLRAIFGSKKRFGVNEPPKTEAPVKQEWIGHMPSSSDLDPDNPPQGGSGVPKKKSA